jgi:tRNA A-37 threonylcarbamoyl transferase component Bud32
MAVLPSLSVDDWHRLNRLLEAALALGSAERAAWLNTLGDEDRHLRAMLDDLLTQSESATFANAEPPTTVAQLAAAALSAMRQEAAGDRVGPWRLERLLAEGGMGAVWIAQRADGVMQRTAALKLPRAEWVDRGLSERIARERAILARLQHAAIAVLYDAGLAEGGRPYLALEYVDGQSIDAWCKSRELKEILPLFIQVVRAVAYAHGQLVIHRDLKPANVLVTADGLPKLLDFGISKLIEGDATTADATALTRLAGRPLTLAYAAPEQVLGLPITVAADVYALGVMLFELVAEARLYRAQEPRALEAEILRGDLRKPSDVTPDKARAKALKGDLDAIVGTALKRNPAERYQTAAALADDLDNYLAGQPVTAQPDSRTYRFGKFINRNRLAVAAAAAVLVALGIGLGTALWQADQARQQADEARNQAERATSLNTFVLSLIRQFDPRASQASKAADLALLSSIERRIDTEFKGSADQLLQLRVTVGNAYRERGHFAAARRVYRRAIVEAETTLPANDVGLLKARVARAWFQIADDEALQSIDTTIELLRQNGPAGIEPLIDALLVRVDLPYVIGRRPGTTWDSLYADAREAHDLAVRHFGAGSAQQLRAAQGLTATLFESGSKRPDKDRAEEAFTVIESALDAARSNPAIAEGNVDLLGAELWYGALLCRFRNSDDGIRRCWNVAAIASKHHGDESLTVERAFFELAGCLWMHGDLRGGASMAVSAYRMATSRDEPSPWRLADKALIVARMVCDLGRGAECAEFTDKALVHAAAMPSGEARSRTMGTLRMAQVHVLILQGATEEAEALAAQFLIEPLCCEQTLHLWRSYALRLGFFSLALQDQNAYLSHPQLPNRPRPGLPRRHRRGVHPSLIREFGTFGTSPEVAHHSRHEERLLRESPRRGLIARRRHPVRADRHRGTSS